MTNPTGAENAQVQDDAERRAREVLELTYSTTYGPGSNLHHAIATALREAEQRGMRRAAEIAWNCGAIHVGKAIERAAAAPITQED